MRLKVVYLWQHASSFVFKSCDNMRKSIQCMVLTLIMGSPNCNNLGQGSQTQINSRAALWQKWSSRAAQRQKMSTRAAKEGKKCLNITKYCNFYYNMRAFDDDAGRTNTSGEPHAARGPRVWDPWSNVIICIRTYETFPGRMSLICDSSRTSPSWKKRKKERWNLKLFQMN